MEKEPEWLDEKIEAILQRKKEGRSRDPDEFCTTIRVPSKFHLLTVSREEIEIRERYGTWRVMFTHTQENERGYMLRETLLRCWKKHTNSQNS